jgi:predicted RNase H-like HicB family nuclease
VHGDSLEIAVDRGEQADDFYVASLMKDMEGPGTVFATASREKDLSLQGECTR